MGTLRGIWAIDHLRPRAEGTSLVLTLHRPACFEDFSLRSCQELFDALRSCEPEDYVHLYLKVPEAEWVASQANRRWGQVIIDTEEVVGVSRATFVSGWRPSEPAWIVEASAEEDTHLTFRFIRLSPKTIFVG